MKYRLSLKLKLTLWFTCFMLLTAALCLVLFLTMRGRIADKEAFQILNLTVRTNLTELTLQDNKLAISQDFSFYKNNVHFLIYSKDHSLLAGQVPPSFPVSTELENGISKYVSGGEQDYFILDFFVPCGWEDGLWLRGILKSPDNNQTLGNSITMFLFILPFFILSVAAGGYLITKKALMPISYITETAENISVGRDLTRRIGMTQGHDEVSRLACAFDHMFERLEQSFESEKQFTSDASHELRTPTSVILAQCSYAAKHADNPLEYREAIEVIERQAQKMSLLIERLLDITRLELGTQITHMESINLSEMCTILCEEQRNHLDSIELSSQIQESVYIHADPFLISRVILNLLDNARKYGKAHIALRLSSSHSTAVLEVEDDGIGIEKEHIDKIWQRFYQVNTSREAGSGLGLGLSMVRQIILLHNGTITVQSTPERGSCFTVSLPATLSNPNISQIIL